MTKINVGTCVRNLQVLQILNPDFREILLSLAGLRRVIPTRFFS